MYSHLVRVHIASLFCTELTIDLLCDFCCFLHILSNFTTFIHAKVKQIRSNCGIWLTLNVEFKILLLFSRITVYCFVVFVRRVFLSHQTSALFSLKFFNDIILESSGTFQNYSV